MKSRLPLLMPLILGGILAGLLLMILPRDWTAGWEFGRGNGGTSAPSAPRIFPQAEKEKAPAPDPAPVDFNLARQWSDAAAKILALLERRLNVEGAREKEALLSFKSEQAYRDFLARAEAAGLKVLDQLDGFRTVRVGYEDLAGLQSDIMGHAADYGDVAANYYAYIPEVPAKEDRAAQTEVPFGDQVLAFLGIDGDNSQWGKGVTLAVLDSGVAADPRFGARLRYLDVGEGITGAGGGDGHGTAVGYLAAGDGGVAPGADVLSIRVTGEDGVSDLFTLAKGIRAAVDAGASVINISLGAYQNSSLLTSAIDYAMANNAVIVAAAGNDGAAQMTWPAADPRVISTGSIGLNEEQSSFSNSGQGLKMSAPGYGINAAWLNGETVVFDGTSASSPIVAGGIVAVMGNNPGMTAFQAAQLIQQYSSDGGAPGADPAYGSGILNMGWAMNYQDPARVDTAVSSHFYNNRTGMMEVVVQNRSGQAVSGLNLFLSDNLNQSTYQIPMLDAGASTIVQLPVNQAELSRAENGILYRSQLVNPDGVADARMSNNQKASTVSRR